MDLGTLRSAGEEALVLHLVNVPNFWRGRSDPRVAIGGVVAGGVVLVGAFMRALINGSDQLVASILAGVAIVGLLVLYGYLRFANATVFLRGRRVGVTNWLGLSKTVSAETVHHLQRSGEVWTGETRTRGVLFIVTLDRRQSLRFAGGDRLEPGGLEQLAGRLRVPIEGSWADLPTWQP